MLNTKVLGTICMIFTALVLAYSLKAGYDWVDDRRQFESTAANAINALAQDVRTIAVKTGLATVEPANNQSTGE